MKITCITALLATAAATATGVHANCTPITPGPATLNGLNETLGVKVEYVNRIPVKQDNRGFKMYNMHVIEGFADRVIFVDQKEGIIWAYKPDDNSINKVYDVSVNVLPTGIDLTVPFPIYKWQGGIKKIHMVSRGIGDKMIVEFTSVTLPSTYSSNIMPLPSGFEYNFDTIGGCASIGAAACNGNPAQAPLCCTGQKVYKLFYEFDFSTIQNALSNPELFFAMEMQNTYGHDGGGMATLDDGRLLYATGDCLPFGLNGLAPAQAEDNLCAKIILLDPSDPGKSTIVAKGVRNSQQINIEGANVVFMDIGGVTAEEVNVVPLAELLDTNTVENFGWGMDGQSRGEEFGREGTFAVGRGAMLEYRNPPCLGDLTAAEMTGMIKPYVQFGRGDDIPLFGISSSVMSDSSFPTIKLATTEFNTGKLIVTLDAYDSSNPSSTQFVNLYKEDSSGKIVLLEHDFNEIVIEDLNRDMTDLSEGARGDARLFKYPDGSAGVFIERTGQFLKLSEINPPRSCQEHSDCDASEKCKKDQKMDKHCKKIKVDCKVRGTKRNKKWGCNNGEICKPVGSQKWAKCIS